MMNDWSMLRRLIWLRAIHGGDSGTLATVTGLSPLTLVNALAKPIKSLIQYGKITTIDGEMYCNNGKLVAVDDELPAGFKRITSIRFDGNFYYDTGVALTGNDEITMTLDDTSTQGQNVFGSYNGTSSGRKNFSVFIYGGGSASASSFRYGEQLVRPRFGSNERTITFGVNGTSGFLTDVSVTLEEFETTATAFIGMLPNSTSPGYTGSIIGTIYNSDRNMWIPCEREEDGVIGYFDTYYWQFLEPIGSGTPIKGDYDSSYRNTLVIDGLTEVLTVGTQRAYPATLLAAGDVKDEQDIITGKVTHRTGIGATAGQITITALANPWQESATAYPLRTEEGTNTINVTSNVDPVELAVEYTAAN